jgi:4-nitrophenyl phosphatase
VGEKGLQDILTRTGFVVNDDDAAAVVVGLDRHLTYRRLVAAFRAIRGGARFVATNADRALPVEDGWEPGAGAIVAAIATATGVQPTVIGKPEPAILSIALERLGADRHHAAIAGDQIQADIRAGLTAGIGTILVTQDAVPEPGPPTPDLTVRDLAELLERLTATRR